jgi:hypothetical protein
MASVSQLRVVPFEKKISEASGLTPSAGQEVLGGTLIVEGSVSALWG